MTDPIIAAQRCLLGCLLGMALGIWYDFLQPVRPRFPILSDSLFILGGSFLWLQLMFGICRGDLRLAAYAALMSGFFLWKSTGSRLSGPFFRHFWGLLIKLINIFTYPCKKFWKN